MKVTIYTDGGADPNPGVGGWAAILQASGREKVLTGNSPSTTNNRMELQAAVAALEALTRPSQVQVHTDSEYLQKGITEWIHKWVANDWKRKDKPISNVDLWKTLWTLTQEHDVKWHWVRGHAGNVMNERVDRLARTARLKIMSQKELIDGIPRLYVRGACKGNPGPGAWGVVLENGEDTEQLSGAVASTTNNRMEMTAVIEGLGMLPSASAVNVISTSDYLLMGATQWIHGWRKREWKKKDGKPVSNQDLWQLLESLMNQYTIHWVSGKGSPEHLSQGLNEAALLAAQAIDLER